MNIDTSKSGWINWTKDFKKKKLTETLELTYNLYKEGSSLEEIAKKREFKVESVERHIIELITKTFIPVEAVINKDKIDEILSVINRIGAESLSKIKEELGENYSWFDIKCVLAHLSSMPEKI